MTKYEILDLRTNLGERVTSFIKFWLTLTLAVFGAAYYGGTNLDLFSSAALLCFYAVLSILTLISIQSIQALMQSLVVDANALSEGAISKDIAPPELGLSRLAALVRALHVLMGTTFLAFCLYVLRGSI